jgi:hypothetical protein
MKKLVVVMMNILFEAYLVVSGNAIERHLLLFAPLVEGNQTIVMGVLSTGQIFDTGQRLNTGAEVWYSGSSPDSQNILIPTQYQISQFHIAPTGLVSQVTTYTFGAEHIAYHPNGQMVISTHTTIFRIKETGLLEVASFYSRPAGTLWISPIGNVMVSSETGKNIGVYHIDTSNFTMTTTQLIYIGGDAHDAVYTPDGRQILVAKWPLGVVPDVDIYHVSVDGTVDTTLVEHVDIANANSAQSIVMSYDGKHAFVDCYDPSNLIATLERISTGQWIEDTSKRVYISDPWQIVMAPVYNILVVRHRITVAGYPYSYLSSYFVNSDGTLVYTGYSFPFQQTFGDDPVDLVFAYPPGVTGINSDRWQLYE